MTTPTTPTGTGATPPACPECGSAMRIPSAAESSIHTPGALWCPRCNVEYSHGPASAGEGEGEQKRCGRPTFYGRCVLDAGHRHENCSAFQPPALSQGGGEPAHPSGESDRRMLLVWQQWAEKVAGNQGAADLFGRVA